MADIHKDRVITGNVSLWASQLYSDITVRSGSTEYKLHRAIICPRSTFFAAACKGEFMEAKSTTISLNDDDPETVNRMLLYLYTLDYPDEDDFPVRAERVDVNQSLLPHLKRKTSATTEKETDLGSVSERAAPYDSRMMNNVLVYAVAEKYDIPELKDLAKHKFETLASSKWPHDDFHAITEGVFTTTPDNDMGLRQIVLDICQKHFYEILKHEESRAGLLENQAIAAVVLDAAVRQIDGDKMLLDRALARQIAVREELSDAEAERQEAVLQKTLWISQLDCSFERANQVQKCRHCHENFQWCLERLPIDDGLKIRLRCASCRTKELLS